MSEERTEEATPKHREDEAKRGNIVQSRDLNSAIIFLGISLLLSALGPFLFSHISQMIRSFFLFR